MADGTRWANRVFDGSGTAVNAATINLCDTGTVTPVRATTTTNSTGDFEIDHATRGLFDIEIVNGTTTRRIVQDVEQQFKSMWLWNADADEYALGVTRTEDAASVVVAYFEGDRATMADGDLAYISLRLSDSAGNQDEQARIGWQATTVLNGATQDGDLILSALVNNTLTEFMRLDGSASEILGATGIDFNLTAASVRWASGVAVIATEYSIQRDDSTVLHLNVPTGATFELSVNDVAQMTLSATAVDFLDNSIATTGTLTIASFAANWTNAGRTVADLGTVTTVAITTNSAATTTFSGGTASTSVSTGTIVISGSGGLGVGGTTFIGGNLRVGNANGAAGAIYAGVDDDEPFTIMAAASAVAADAGFFAGRRARGTLASPANVTSADITLSLGGQPYSGASGYWRSGEIRFVVAGTVTDNQRPGSKIEFYTNEPNGAQTLQAVINNDGVVNLKDTTPSTTTTSGALVVSGGGGFAGAIFAGTNISAGVAGSATGTFEIVGTTSGIVTVTVAAAAGTWTMQLPA